MDPTAALPPPAQAAPPAAPAAWLAAGLRFRCVGCECGDCCSGKHGPGAVWVDRSEMAALARHLALEFDTFTARFVRRIDERFSLTEQPNHDCIFYAPGRGCTVYAARPGQCRAYPFWPKILRSPESWRAEAACCPGIRPDAELVPAAEIGRALALHAAGGAALPPGELDGV